MRTALTSGAAYFSFGLPCRRPSGRSGLRVGLRIHKLDRVRPSDFRKLDGGDLERRNPRDDQTRAAKDVCKPQRHRGLIGSVVPEESAEPVTVCPILRATVLCRRFARDFEKGAWKTRIEVLFPYFFVWPQKTMTVEMNDVIGIIHETHFRLPTDIADEFSECLRIFESAHIDPPGGTVSRQFL